MAGDIDLMFISDSLTHGEAFGALERVTRAVGRKVNPTVYTAAEFSKRAQTENAFVTRVLEQPRLWVMDRNMPPHRRLSASRVRETFSRRSLPMRRSSQVSSVRAWFLVVAEPV